MTIISSGGFLPTINNLSMIIVQNSQIIIFSILMLVSFFSIFFLQFRYFSKRKNINFFHEDIHLFLYFVISSWNIFYFF